MHVPEQPSKENNMTPEQALHLYRQINKGQPQGSDADGIVVHAETALGNCMEMIGAQSYVVRSHHDPKYKERGRNDGSVYVV
jgi:hypothetical protein